MVVNVIPVVIIATNSRNTTLDGIRIAEKSTSAERAIIADPRNG